jgi:predicted dehydrogenase
VSTGHELLAARVARSAHPATGGDPVPPTAPSSPPVLGVGIVGLSAAGGWASFAHLPALAAVDGFEVRGLVASSPAAARAAAEAHGVPVGLDSVEALAARDDVDLVVVSVKVPRHRELVLPALAAGKAVLCEWPVGNGLAEADELVAAAGDLRTFVGLQGRSAPTVRFLRDLVADGYVGEVLSTSLVASGGQWGGTTTSAGAYLLDRDLGATMLTITFGHLVDSIALVLGELVEVTATTATRRPEVLDTDTGRTVPMTAEDQVAVTGTLAGGAVASLHMRAGRSRGTNLLWEVDGTDGVLQVTSRSGQLHSSTVAIRGSRGGGPMEDLAVPAGYDRFPALAGQPSHAVAHAWAQVRDDLAEDTRVVPDFAHGRRRHLLLDAIQRAAADGTRHRLEP